MSLLLAQSGHPDMLNKCAFGGKADMRLTGIRHGLMPSRIIVCPVEGELVLHLRRDRLGACGQGAIAARARKQMP